MPLLTLLLLRLARLALNKASQPPKTWWLVVVRRKWALLAIKIPLVDTSPYVHFTQIVPFLSSLPIVLGKCNEVMAC